MVAGLLLENKPLNHLGVGSQDLLTPGHGFHLPSGLLAGTVLLFGMHVAVFVTMELIRKICHLTTGAGVQFTARLLGNVTPESASLMVAATAASSGSAASLALALGLGCLATIEEAVAQGGGLVRHGPSLSPAILVLCSDSAHNAVSQLEHEGLLLESTSVHHNFCGSVVPGDGGVDAIGTDTLKLVVADSIARRGAFPRDDSLVAV